MFAIHAVRRQPLVQVQVMLMLAALVLGLLPVLSARAFSNGQAATLVLGQSSFTTTNGLSRERFYNPYAVAIDPTTGALFVADTDNRRVLRFDSLTSLSNGAPADGVLGQPDFTSDAAATSAQGIAYLYGIAVDADGRLWVADAGNNRVLRFDAAASKPNGAPADGVLGQPGFTTNALATSATGVHYPWGVAADANGRLWVADWGNNRVLRFDNAARKPNGAPADGVLGQPDFTTNTPATDARGMIEPSGVAVDAGGRVWVTDTPNNRVLRFDAAAGKPNGAPADGVLGQPDFTTNIQATSAQGMYTPKGVSVDRGGRLWVTDTINSRVLRFDAAASKPNGAPADGVLGQPNFTSRGYGINETSARQMNFPGSAAADGSGRLWVVDTESQRVLRFDDAANKPNGAPADGLLGSTNFSTRWPTSVGLLRFPRAVAVDPTTGKVFVADFVDARVLRFASREHLSNGAMAEAVLGQPDFSSNFGATSAQGMDGPFGLAVDTSGRLWVADPGNHRVLRFDAAASKPNGAAADGVLGQPAFTSNTPGTSAQQMYYPAKVAVDSQGHLWVADSSNGRVLRFDAAASKPNGAPADGVLGQPDFFSNKFMTTAQGMYLPRGLSVDGSGRLWVADNGNNRVLRFDNAASKPNGASADGVLGQSDFTSREYAINAQRMGSPQGVTVDTNGRLWVADYYYNRVLWFDAAASQSNGAPANGVLGQPDFTSRTEATTAQGMYRPYDVAVDRNGGIWVADGWNNRVLLFETLVPPPTPTPAAGLTRTDNPPYHSRCQQAPAQVSFSGTVRMPPGYQTATLQVNWYITSPSAKRTSPIYQMWTVQDGAAVSLPVRWPGIDPGDGLVHVHIGSVLLDPLTLKPILGTARSFSEYWYPWVCSAPVVAPTPTPTPTP